MLENEFYGGSIYFAKIGVDTAENEPEVQQI